MGWHGDGMDLVWTMDAMVDGVLLCVLCAPCTAIAQLDFVSLYFLWQEHNNYVKLVLLLQGSLDASPLPPRLLKRLASWDLLRLIMHVMYVFIYEVALKKIWERVEFGGDGKGIL